MCSLGLGQKSLQRLSSRINSPGAEWEVVGVGPASPPKFKLTDSHWCAHQGCLLLSVAISVATACLLAGIVGPLVNSSRQQVPFEGPAHSCSLLWVLAPNKSPHWEAGPRNHARITWTCLLVVAGWMDTWPKQSPNYFLVCGWRNGLSLTFCSHVLR